jgi:hypothetical protein
MANGERALSTAATAGLVLLFAGALALSWTIPFQEWDAYSSGHWAVRIAHGSPLFPPAVDRILEQRPLVFVGEGLIWRALGHVSMRAARLYSLAFAVALVLATFRVARESGSSGSSRSRISTALVAAFLAAASPLVTEQVSSTLTDIPAAALAWWGYVAARAAARAGRSTWRWLAAGVLFAGSLLAKPIVAPLVPLLVAAAVWPQLQGKESKEKKRLDGDAWTAAAIGLGLPALLYLVYFDWVRHGAGWGYVLVGWAGPYYSTLAEGYRLSNLRQVQWFGVLSSAALVVAVASSVGRAPRVRTAAAWALLAGAVAWIAFGTAGLTDPLRPFESGSLDRWLAGWPALAALVVLGVVALLRRSAASPRPPWELLAAAAPFCLLWWWKLGYDRRFLVAVLPAVCVFVAEWLPLDSRAAVACAVVWLAGVGWEGSRRMDRAFPVFSRQLVDINRKNGLAPEAKLVDIFGESARDIERLQAMARQDPSLKFVSPDNRLAFHLGDRVAIRYVCTEGQLAQYDVLVWLHNSGVLQQYAYKYGVRDPLGRLRATGRLVTLWKSPEYEVFRVLRSDPARSGSSTRFGIDG